jgi:hypothetical protein
MIQVKLNDGFVVFEFASAVEFVEAFPDGLSQDSLDMGAFVALSDKEANDVAFERRQINNKRQKFQRLPQVGVKRNRSISELMVEKD